MGRGTFTDRNGEDVTQEANIGALQSVQVIYGRGQTWRLTQL